MKFSKKQLLVISTAIILLATSSITFAYIFYSHEVNLSGGVSTEGAVVTYEEDGVTLLNEFEFEDFHPTPFAQAQSHNFVVKNVGNSLCDVTWEIAESSVIWTPLYYEVGDNWYYGDSSDPNTVNLGFWVETPDETPITWNPAGYGSITLDVGESALYRFVLTYRGLDNSATDFTIHIHFATTDEIV